MTLSAVYDVLLQVDGGIFGVFLPESHRSLWKPRRLVYRTEAYQPDTLHKYHRDADKKAEINANIVHALLTGCGLLSIEDAGNNTPLVLINLVLYQSGRYEVILDGRQECDSD
jgi:hypothetical protein